MQPYPAFHTVEREAFFCVSAHRRPFTHTPGPFQEPPCYPRARESLELPNQQTLGV